MELEKELFTFSRRKMARYLGMSPTAVWNRLQKLEKRKEIVSYYSPGRLSLYHRKIRGEIKNYDKEGIKKNCILDYHSEK